MGSLTELPVGHSERLMTLRVPLQRSRYMTIICAYAPTQVSPEEQKDNFYQELTSLLSRVDNSDKVVLLGDFNARVGRQSEMWDGAIGPNGSGQMNSNGLRLLSLCYEFNLTITNTIFRLKDMYKNTWRHPRSGHWHTRYIEEKVWSV